MAIIMAKVSTESDCISISVMAINNGHNINNIVSIMLKISLVKEMKAINININEKRQRINISQYGIKRG